MTDLGLPPTPSSPHRFTTPFVSGVLKVAKVPRDIDRGVNRKADLTVRIDHTASWWPEAVLPEAAMESLTSSFSSAVIRTHFVVFQYLNSHYGQASIVASVHMLVSTSSPVEGVGSLLIKDLDQNHTAMRAAWHGQQSLCHPCGGLKENAPAVGVAWLEKVCHCAQLCSEWHVVASCCLQNKM